MMETLQRPSSYDDDPLGAIDQRIQEHIDDLVFWMRHELVAEISEAIAEPSAKPVSGSAKGTADDDAYVGVSKLDYQSRGFANYKKFRAFLMTTPEIRTRWPRYNRMEVHAGDWFRYWDAQNQRQFAALDVDPANVARVVERRTAAVRRKKKKQ